MKKFGKSLLSGFGFAFLFSIIISLIVASLIFFEVIGVVFGQKLLYSAYVLILFVIAFTTARKVGSRGLFVGIGISILVILLGTLYRFIGVETGLTAAFGIRTAITSLVAIVGAIAGVNTVK